MGEVEQVLGDLRKLADRIAAGKISDDWTPEMIAQAAAIEERLKTHPVSDEEAVAAGAAFICFTPLGGD